MWKLILWITGLMLVPALIAFAWAAALMSGQLFEGWPFVVVFAVGLRAMWQEFWGWQEQRLRARLRREAQGGAGRRMSIKERCQRLKLKIWNPEEDPQPGAIMPDDESAQLRRLREILDEALDLIEELAE